MDMVSLFGEGVDPISRISIRTVQSRLARARFYLRRELTAGEFFGKYFFHDLLPPVMILLQNHGEGGSSFVQLRPQLEPLADIEGFLSC